MKFGSELGNIELWKKVESDEELEVDEEYQYDLCKGIKIALISFKHFKQNISFYLVEDGIYSYIDGYPTTYTKLYPGYKILDRIIKIVEESILLLGREVLYPNEKEFIYIYSEFIEEYNYELEEYEFGFMGLNDYKKMENNCNSDYIDFDITGIISHTREKSPIYLASFYSKKKASEKENDDILEDFKSFEKRLEIMGFDKIKSNIVFTNDHNNGSFYIILQEK